MAANDDKPFSDTTALRIAGSWLQALTDGSKEVVALLDEDGSVQYLSVSGAVQGLLGYDALEIMAMRPSELLHPLDTKHVLDAFRTVAAHPGGRITIEYRARHRSGHYVRLESTAVNRLRNEFVNAIVVHTREVFTSEVPAPTSSAMPSPHLEDEEGLFFELSEAIEKAAGKQYRFSLLVLELERADTLVEAYGQEVADGVLHEVGRRLHALLRPGDKLSRLRSGEFAVLLDGVGERPLAERISARIQKTIGNRYSVKGQDVFCSAIIGIVTSERRYERGEDVLRDALLAAARARGEDGDRRAVYRTQMQVQKTRHMSLMAELHNALQRGEFRVHYLPIVDLATRTVSGFEALARWEHPERGLISPELFIPIAEETGLIVQLGRWVMLQACNQMAEWIRRYPMDPPLSVHVNISGKQFADYDLHDQVDNILEDTGLEPNQLVVEVTERSMLEFRDAVTDTLARLRRSGVRTAMDNFGTGASSFSYLHQAAYDLLKIDRSLVGIIISNNSGVARDVLRALVEMAHNLRMQVIAEGIETPGQAAQMSKLWCEYAQGYLFSKPIDADAAGALIASYPRWWA
jgi:diguanylate cyclase (GGDEF)-like protein/PAS domain S-box-containing protein